MVYSKLHRPLTTAWQQNLNGIISTDNLNENPSFKWIQIYLYLHIYRQEVCCQVWIICMCVHVVVVWGALKGVVTHEGIKGEADKGWWRVWFADWIEPSWDDFSYLSINLFVWIWFVSPFAETSMMRAAKLNLRMATIFSRPFIHLKKSVNRSAQRVKE